MSPPTSVTSVCNLESLVLQIWIAHNMRTKPCKQNYGFLPKDLAYFKTKISQCYIIPFISYISAVSLLFVFGGLLTCSRSGSLPWSFGLPNKSPKNQRRKKKKATHRGICVALRGWEYKSRVLQFIAMTMKLGFKYFLAFYTCYIRVYIYILWWFLTQSPFFEVPSK